MRIVGERGALPAFPAASPSGRRSIRSGYGGPAGAGAAPKAAPAATGAAKPGAGGRR